MSMLNIPVDYDTLNDMLKTSEALQTLPMSFMSESLVGGVPDFKMLTYATTSTSESFGTNLSKFDERNHLKRL